MQLREGRTDQLKTRLISVLTYGTTALYGTVFCLGRAGCGIQRETPPNPFDERALRIVFQ